MFIAVGTTIDDKFEVRGTIGSGGMGVVYEAFQATTGRMVAIKLLTYAPADNAEDCNRFAREATALSRLTHPHIVRFYSYGIWQGYPYIAMERLQGVNLQKLIATRESGLDVDLTLKIGIQLASALQHAHSEGIIHRDLKPSNVVMTNESPEAPEIKIIDFGLAKLTGIDGQQKLTQTGHALGSVMYMSPEQCLGQQVDGRTDIYGVGCLLFHCFTGQPPFTAENGVAMMFQHLNEPVAQSEGWHRLTPAAKQIVGRCLAKQAQHRYASAADLEADLRSLLAGDGDTISYAAVPDPPGQKRRSGRLSKFFLVGAALLCVLAIGAVVVVQYFQGNASDTAGNTAGNTTGSTADGATDSITSEAASISTTKVAYLRGTHLQETNSNHEGARIMFLRANQLLEAENKKGNTAGKTDIRTAFHIKLALVQNLQRLAEPDKAFGFALQAIELSKTLSKEDQGGALDFACSSLSAQGKDLEALKFARLAARKFDDALVDYGPGATTFSTRTAAYGWARVAECCERLGKYKDAEAAARKAVEYADKLPDAAVRFRSLKCLAQSRYAQGKVSQALKDMQQWQAIEASQDQPELPWLDLSSGRQFLCLLHTKTGDPKAARLDLEADRKYARHIINVVDRAFAGGKWSEEARAYYKLNEIEAGDRAWATSREHLKHGASDKLIEKVEPEIKQERELALRRLATKPK